MSPLFGICRFIFELSFGCSLFGRKLFSPRFGCLLFGLHCVMKKIGWQLVGHIFGGKIWPWFVLLTMRDQKVCLGLVWGQKKGHLQVLGWKRESFYTFYRYPSVLLFIVSKHSLLPICFKNTTTKLVLSKIPEIGIPSWMAYIMSNKTGQVIDQ